MSKALAAVALAVGAIAAVVAVVVSIIPFSHSGTAEPTAAFRAQSDLDEVLFKLASSPAAKYTGSVTQKNRNNSLRIDFTDLTSTISNSTEGTVTVDNNQGEYRQIGNERFLSAPLAFWNSVLLDADKARKDLAPVDRKWTNARGSQLPALGNILAPDILAGTLGTVGGDAAPELSSVAMDTTDPTFPDARFWPVADPPVTFVGDNVVRIGSWDVTYDPDSKAVTHVKGENKIDDDLSLDYDLAVTLLPADQAERVFASQRALVAELVDVPAPGLYTAPNAVTGRTVGTCTRAACSWEYTGSGSVIPEARSVGYVNYGLTVNFFVGGRPAAAPCRTVIRAEIGSTGKATCVARNITGAGDTVSARPSFQYLAFTTRSVEAFNGLIDDTQKRSNQQVTFVRTGSKKAAADGYSAPLTGLPSYYAIKRGDYLFDGFNTTGELMVTYGPGYASSITGGSLKSEWATIIADQLTRQVQAAGDTDIVWFAAEEQTATALRAIVSQAGKSDKVTVVLREPTS